jgi:hypothetical protein
VNAADIHELLSNRLGLRKVKQTGSGWINATCPFESRHGGGKDEFPSFGVAVADNRSSRYNCKSGSCRASGGNITSLLFALYAHKVRPQAVLEAAFWWAISRDNWHGEATFRLEHEERRLREEGPRGPKKIPRSYDWKSVVTAAINPAAAKADALFALDTPIVATLPESSLNKWRGLSDDALKFLKGSKRNLSEETIKIWEFGSGFDWQGFPRISIPVRDHEQKLVGISKRRVEHELSSGKWEMIDTKIPPKDPNDPPKSPKFLHSKGFKKSLFLFGECRIVKGRTARLVEGHFDVIGLWQAGYQNALAVMGSDLSREQIEKIVKWFSDVVVFGDGDPAGAAMARAIEQVLQPRIPTRVAETILGKDPDQYSDNQLTERLGPPDRQLVKTDQS